MSLSIHDLMNIQLALQEKYQGVWEGDSPETAKHHLLYAVEEIGEVSAILKKRGPEAVMEHADVKARFCEEMADVFMYLTDVLICCGVSADDFVAAYRKKAEKNLQRNFVAEHHHYLEKQNP